MASTANRDEALKCITISQRQFNAGNLSSARRFAEKSIALFPTPEAKRLLEIIVERESQPSSSTSATASGNSTPTAEASGAEAHPTAGTTHHRHKNAGASTSTSPLTNGSASADEKRDYTPEMAAVVKRVRKCKVTEYYEIMGLQKDCEEADVKRAYRKLALQLHPDKNNAPGADEAFKLVSKAFQILSDPQKRAAYDRHGDDPDSRFAGMSQSGFGPMGAGGGFQGEMSPEELFNMFFGGGGPMGNGFGGGFGGGPVFTATFGPGGWQTSNFGRRRAPQTQEERASANRRQFLHLLPFLFIFFFPLISGLFSSLFSTPTIPDPSYSFDKTTGFSSLRYTTPHKVPYYVNLPSFKKHPIYESIPEKMRSDAQAGRTAARSSLLSTFESRIEDRFANAYWSLCQQEHRRKQQEIDRAQGFFGIGADMNKIREIENRPVESCDKLRQYGFLKD